MKPASPDGGGFLMTLSFCAFSFRQGVRDEER